MDAITELRFRTRTDPPLFSLPPFLTMLPALPNPINGGVMPLS